MLAVAGDRNRFAQQLFAPLPHRYDQLAEVLSLGQNGRWRWAMIDRIASTSPGSVLDVATGTAGVALQLAERTQSHVVGVDLTSNMLARGRKNVAKAGLSARIQLVACRAEQLPFSDGTFDALTFTYLLRYVDDPQATLCELARVVKPGGVVSILLPSDPGFAWRLGRNLGPRRSAERVGLAYDYWMAREHINPINALVELIKYYFDDLQQEWWPFRFPSMDLNLFYACHARLNEHS